MGEGKGVWACGVGEVSWKAIGEGEMDLVLVDEVSDDRLRLCDIVVRNAVRRRSDELMGLVKLSSHVQYKVGATDHDAASARSKPRPPL